MNGEFSVAWRKDDLVMERFKGGERERMLSLLYQRVEGRTDLVEERVQERRELGVLSTKE